MPEYKVISIAHISGTCPNGHRHCWSPRCWLQDKENNVEQEYLTTPQAAERLGITRRRVIALIASGRLPATKHGNAWAIKEDDLELVKERKTGRPPKGKLPVHIETQDRPSAKSGPKVAYFISSPPSQEKDGS